MSHTDHKTQLLIAGAICSTVLALALGVYCWQLGAQNHRNTRLIEDQRLLLSQKDTQANTTANYTDTICAEYRKLYQAYTALQTQHPSSTTGYALPGSAKGTVDSCYQK
jgi:uncharacterized protein HemX